MFDKLMCMKILYRITCSHILALSAKFPSTDNFRVILVVAPVGVLVSKLIRPFKLRDTGEMQL